MHLHYHNHKVLYLSDSERSQQNLVCCENCHSWTSHWMDCVTISYCSVWQRASHILKFQTDASPLRAMYYHFAIWHITKWNCVIFINYSPQKNNLSNSDFQLIAHRTNKQNKRKLKNKFHLNLSSTKFHLSHPFITLTETHSTHTHMPHAHSFLIAQHTDIWRSAGMPAATNKKF